MSDFIDDFLAGLEEDSQKPQRSSSITKLLMSSRDNQGTIVFAPFQDTVTKKFYLAVNNVREFRTTMPNYRNGEDEVWVKILPKEFYGDLTPQQSALYDEVVGLFDQCDSDLEDMANKWSTIRVRNYSLFQGVLINHINIAGAQLKDSLGKPALFIFPSKQPINELAVAIKNKIAGMNNSKEWIPAVFSPTVTGREGVVTISFTKPDAPGYDCNVGFEFNSAYAKVVDPVVGFPEDVVKEFGSILELFLGWQNGDNSLFNEANFKSLKDIFTVEIAKHTPHTYVDGNIENKNGVDPMLNTSAAPEPIPTPNPTSTAAPSATSPDGGTGVNVPF